MAHNRDDHSPPKTPRRTRGALARLRREMGNFSDAERRVAEVLLERPGDVVALSVTQVADLAGVSEATVVRLCQSLGFSGFAEIKIRLASEITEPFNIVHADIVDDDGPEQILEKVFRSDMQTLFDSLTVVDRRAFAEAVEAIAGAGEVHFFGVGTSAPIALDASYRFEQIGIRSKAIVDSIQMGVTARHLPAGSLVCGISNSGATRATLEAMELARQSGAKTMCITSFQRSPIVSVCDISLVVASRELAYRFEAMASRLAHLALLDALHVAVAHLDVELRQEILKRSAEVIARHRF